MPKLGIWLNQREATLVILRGDRFETRVSVVHVQSEVEGHHKSTGGRKGAAPYMQRSASAGAESKLEHRREQDFHHFFELLQPWMREADWIYLMGPGQFKLKIKHLIEARRELAKKLRDVQSADRMTEKQIVAKVRKYFERPAERSGPPQARR